MTIKYNIGTLNDQTLVSLGFKPASDEAITLQNCIIGTRELNKTAKYVAILSSASASEPLDIKGICYKGSNYNPKVNPDDTSGTLFDVYEIPSSTCEDLDNCLIENSKKFLDAEKKEIEAEVYDINVRLWAINNKKDYQTAETEYKNNIQATDLQARLAVLNTRKAALNEQLLSQSARNSEASILLSDKNRLLATVNSNIQQKYTKLEDVNNKINTITQDIYTNNMEMKRKENIIQTLKVIIIIVFLMAIVLIIYFGMNVIEEKYPNAINNMVNNFNKNNNGLFY
jgi:hypothetical protein